MSLDLCRKIYLNMVNIQDHRLKTSKLLEFQQNDTYTKHTNYIKTTNKEPPQLDNKQRQMQYKNIKHNVNQLQYELANTQIK